MNSFAEALKRANIDVKVEEPKFIPYESVKDVRFPVMLENDLFYSINQELLKDANYIRSSMVPLDRKSFEKRVKLFEASKIKQWVLDNIDKCYEINTGGARKIESKYIKRDGDDFERIYEKDTQYGLCCLGYYIEYSLSSRKISVKFQHSTDLTYQAAGIDPKTLNISEFSFSYKEDDWITALDALAKVSEFVPVMINCSNCVHWNHWEDFPLFGKPLKYPTLGINLMENEKVMEKLKDWISAGGRINPRVWYYLNQRGDGHWYLKRDLDSSPRIKK